MNEFEKLKQIEPYNLKAILNPSNIYVEKDMELAADLFKNLVNLDDAERYTAEEALSHPFFKCTEKIE